MVTRNTGEYYRVAIYFRSIELVSVHVIEVANAKTHLNLFRTQQLPVCGHDRR